jgi:hypothetical protein
VGFTFVIGLFMTSLPLAPLPIVSLATSNGSTPRVRTVAPLGSAPTSAGFPEHLA